MEENRLYIQTELCSCTLDAEMKRGPLSVERRYKLLREILVALEFIHRNGMVHLDIKPENVFVKNDQYKLGDFGLVSTTTNNSDVEEGDSRYMSMELLSGDHDDLTKVSNKGAAAMRADYILHFLTSLSIERHIFLGCNHVRDLPRTTASIGWARMAKHTGRNAVAFSRNSVRDGDDYQNNDAPRSQSASSSISVAQEGRVAERGSETAIGGKAESATSEHGAGAPNRTNEKANPDTSWSQACYYLEWQSTKVDVRGLTHTYTQLVFFTLAILNVGT